MSNDESERLDEPIPYSEFRGFHRLGPEIAWSSVAAEPSWWSKPAAMADRFSFRTKGLYRRVASARRSASRKAKDDVRDLLFDHLQPVLGNEGTLPVLEEMLRQTQLVNAVLGRVVDGEGEDLRDMHAACMCWRTPIRSVVEKFEPSLQGRIEWVLLRPILHWRQADEVPKWAGSLPQRAGYLRCAFAAGGNVPESAQRAVVTGARDNVRAHLIAQMASIVGQASATKAAHAAVERLAPVDKAFVDERERHYQNGEMPKRGPQCTAYCLWEVPLEPLLRELPKEHRAAVRAALLAM